MNIRIGTFDYKLEFKEEPIIYDFVTCKGLINYNDLIIQIQEKQHEQHKKQTILHEVFHGIINEYGIEIGNADLEYLVDNLGTAMFQVIKDNPELTNYLQGKD